MGTKSDLRTVELSFPCGLMGHLLSSLPRPDLVESGKRLLKFGIEEPHRIKNLAESCRCSCPVGMSKGEDAIVSQISHNSRIGNSVVEQVA